MQINEIILFRKENENISVKKKKFVEPVFLKQVHVRTCNSSRILTHVHKKNKSHCLYINAEGTFLSKRQHNGKRIRLKFSSNIDVCFVYLLKSSRWYLCPWNKSCLKKGLGTPSFPISFRILVNSIAYLKGHTNYR